VIFCLFLTVIDYNSILLLGIAPASYAASSTSATQTVTVTVSSTVSITAPATITFGAVAADGSTYTQGDTISSTSNVAIDIYTKALAWTGGISSPLALTDFQFQNATLTNTIFTTSYQKVITNLAKAPKSGVITSSNNLLITVPFGTDPASYSTTIYDSAVSTGGTAPTSP